MEMVVNPFWFGVLMTLIVEIVLAFIAAFISVNKRSDEDIEEQKKVNDALLKAIEKGELNVISLRKDEEGEDDEDH